VRIIDSRLTPGAQVYSIVCFCGFPFQTAADNRKKVKCPKCRREADLRVLLKQMNETPKEKLKRLKEVAAAARKLYNQWLAIPEPERDKKEGKEMAGRLEEYFAEARGIIADVKLPAG
jgi:hypothetical protein